MDGLLVIGVSQLVQSFARVGVMFQRAVEMMTVGFLLQPRQQRLQRRFYRADVRLIEMAMRAEAAGIDIELNDFRVFGIESAVGEFGAEQH